MRTGIGVALLAFQVFMIGYARFVPSRYFCWAPYDTQTDYRLDLSVNGKKLTAKQIQARYKRPKAGSDNRSPQHVMDILQGYDETYGKADRAEIVMKYRVNGREEREWRWPAAPGIH
jgi:hypothetical protein